MAVALQLAVSLVALAARAGRDIGPRRPAELSVNASQNGSILAGGTFTQRRGSKTSAARTPSSPVTTAPAAGVAPAPGGAPSEPPAATTVPAAEVPATAGPSPEKATTARPADSPTTSATAPAPVMATGTAAATGDPGRPGTLADPAGDTFVDGTQRTVSESRADIVRAGAAYGPGGITFAMQVQRPTDPRTDERWAADSTYAQWSVDTNGDSASDYEVQYFFVDEDNFGGSVSRPGDAGGPVCDVTAATFSAEGYKMTVDPACLGNPASFSYRATIFYDTNPADDNADVVSDMAPNRGQSFPVTRPS